MRTRAATMMGMGLLTALIASWMGLEGRLDRALRRAYYRFEQPASEEPPCLIVAFDQATVEHWGPPPWSANRLAKIVERATDAGARAIAVVEPQRRLVASGWPQSASLLAADASDDPSLADSPSVPLEQVELRDDRGRFTVAGELIRQLAPTLLDRDSLFIHYASEGSVLPSVSAYRVEQGDIPEALLRARVLLLGITAPPFARRVSTPVGFLAPAQVHASALTSAVVSPPFIATTWVRWLLTALVLALQVVIVSRRSLSRLFGATAGVVLLAVLADGLVFDVFHVTVGVSLIAFASLGACLAFVVADHRASAEAIFAGLRSLAAYRAQRPASGEEDESAFWDRLGSLPEMYVAPSSSALYIVPAQQQHLALRWSRGMSDGDVRERRRDVGRSPYNKALSAQRALWEPEFMRPEHGVSTLLVPLTAFSRVLGLWVLNFPSGAQLAPASMALLEYLSHEGATVLERRHLELDRRPTVLREGSRLHQGVEDLKEAADRLAKIHAAYQQLMGAMPVGLLVASITGEVTFSNATMVQALGEASVPVGAQRSLSSILARLTRSSVQDVRMQLRDLLCDPQAVTLEVSSDTGELLPYAFGLFRLGHGALFGIGTRDDSPWPGTFVLTAHSQPEAADELGPRLSRASDPPDVRGLRPGIGIDLREVLLRVVRRLRARHAGCDRALELELDDPLPILGSTSRRALSLALGGVLYDVLRHGSECASGRVAVQRDGDEVVLRITDPAHALPQASLFALTAQSDDASVNPNGIVSVARAKEVLQGLGATLEVESRIGSGTMFTVRIPCRTEDAAGSGA